MTARPDTWMPLFIGDYLADTMHLSAEEHGAYMLLIMHYWRNGGAIKNDKNLIKNIAKISSKKLQNVLAFFEEENGCLHHKRIDRELSDAAENQEKNKQRTKAATEARLVKNGNVTNNVTSDVTSDVAFTPTPLPTVLKEEEDRKGGGEMRARPPQGAPPSMANLDTSLKLNNFMVCVDIVCSLFGKKRLSPKEQEILTAWCELYDMRKALPLVESELKKFRDKNHKDPNSIAYFSGALENAPHIRLPGRNGMNVNGLVKGLSAKMRV